MTTRGGRNRATTYWHRAWVDRTSLEYFVLVISIRSQIFAVYVREDGARRGTLKKRRHREHLPSFSRRLRSWAAILLGQNWRCTILYECAKDRSIAVSSTRSSLFLNQSAEYHDTFDSGHSCIIWATMQQQLDPSGIVTRRAVLFMADSVNTTKVFGVTPNWCAELSLLSIAPRGEQNSWMSLLAYVTGGHNVVARYNQRETTTYI